MPWSLPRAANAGPRTLLTLGAFLLLLAGCLQVENLDHANYRWSTAASGLVLREGPGLEFTRIGAIPFGARVRLLGIASEETLVGGRPGRWNKVDYQGLVGYCYDAFLAEAPPEWARISAGQLPASTNASTAPVPRSPGKKNKETRSRRERFHSAGRETKGIQERSPETTLPPAAAFAYAVHDMPGLTRLSSKDFDKIAGPLAAHFRGREAAFHSSAGERGKDEPAEDYLKRSEQARRRFLEQLRGEEHAAATRVYSIYDARLELGPYRPTRGWFAWLGTTVPIDASGWVITLPDDQARRHRFLNGRKYDVEMPLSQAAAIRDAQDEIRVRIDFSYTESLQDPFHWTLKAYFLPRYLMLYHRQTGRIYYACRILPQVDQISDPVTPLRISARLLEETVY